MKDTAFPETVNKDPSVPDNEYDKASPSSSAMSSGISIVSTAVLFSG